MVVEPDNGVVVDLQPKKRSSIRRSTAIAMASVVALIAVVSVALAMSSTPFPQLAAKLLSANQVPVTWQSEDFSKAFAGTGCLSRVLSPKHLQPTAAVNVLYTNDGSVPPEVGEALATYRNASEAFQSIVTALGHCKYINGGSPNPTGIYGTVAPLAFPRFGSSSTAFTASLTAQQVPVTVTNDFVIVKKGRYILEIFESNLGNVNRRQFEKFITRALAKV
jgi:hypothetical protein